MELQEGKNIERLLVGSVKKAAQLTDREFQHLAFATGVNNVRDYIRQRILSGNSLNSDYGEAILRGLKIIRSDLRTHFDQEKEIVRKNQIETDPSLPKSIFARNLIQDLDGKLSDIVDMEDGERYELRFYSAGDTKLDFAGSFDFWVEIYDIKLNKAISDVQVDIKIKPDQAPKGMADMTYYFDNNRYLDAETQTKLDMAYRNDPEYEYLVSKSVKLLRERSKIRFAA